MTPPFPPKAKEFPIATSPVSDIDTDKTVLAASRSLRSLSIPLSCKLAIEPEKDVRVLLSGELSAEEGPLVDSASFDIIEPIFAEISLLITIKAVLLFCSFTYLL